MKQVVDTIVQAISNVELVSFDIFDTLLLRCYHKPSDVWRAVQRDAHAPGYALMRKVVNRFSYSAKPGYDPTFDDVYRMMPFYRTLRESELLEEKRGLRANPEMLHVWNEAGAKGKTRIIVSDMYLPEEFITTVLKENGIRDWDRLYVSNAQQKTKSDGALFKQVLSDFRDIPASRILHIGDNAHSDVEVPSMLGLVTYHYVPPLAAFLKDNPFVAQFLRRDKSLRASRLVATLSQIDTGTALDEESTYWRRVGLILGSVLATMYVRFIDEQVKKHSVNRVIFVARDGYSLMPIYRMLNSQMCVDYVYAPRKVISSEDPAVYVEYKRYIDSFEIKPEERVAIVDSCSISFSSQKLIAKALGRNVFGIFLVAFKPPRNGVALFYNPGMRFRWYNFAELAFSAPTRPIARVRNLEPVFIDGVPSSELYRISNYPQVSDAMIKAATILIKEDAVPTPKQWLRWVGCFMDNMTDVDRMMFAKASHCSDASHKSQVAVFLPQMKKGVRYYLVPVLKRLAYMFMR